jgi:hypothetical protein
MSKSNSNPPGKAVTRLLLDSSDKRGHVFSPRLSQKVAQRIQKRIWPKFSEILGCLFEFHSASALGDKMCDSMWTKDRPARIDACAHFLSTVV